MTDQKTQRIVDNSLGMATLHAIPGFYIRRNDHHALWFFLIFMFFLGAIGWFAHDAFAVSGWTLKHYMIVFVLVFSVAYILSSFYHLYIRSLITQFQSLLYATVANTDTMFWAVAQPETGWVAVYNQGYGHAFARCQPANLDDFISSEQFNDEQQEKIREAITSRDAHIAIQYRDAEGARHNAMLHITSPARPEGFIVIRAVKEA